MHWPHSLICCRLCKPTSLLLVKEPLFQPPFSLIENKAFGGPWYLGRGELVSNLLFLTVFFSRSLLLRISTSFIWTWFRIELLSLRVAIYLLVSYWRDEMGRKKGTALLKYLIVQFVAGGIVLGSLLLSEDWWQALLAIALSLKIGLVPLHSWVVDIFRALSLWERFYLSVVSKIRPLLLIVQWLPSDWIYPLGALSIVRGSLMGIIYSDTRHIIACSSIIGTRWLAIAMSQGPELRVVSILFYSFQSYAVIWSLHHFGASTLSNMATRTYPNQRLLFKSTRLGATLIANLRLPSYTFFALKLFVILETKWYLLLLVSLLASSLSLVWYSRIINILWVNDSQTYIRPSKGTLTMWVWEVLLVGSGLIGLWIISVGYWFSII